MSATSPRPARARRRVLALLALVVLLVHALLAERLAGWLAAAEQAAAGPPRLRAVFARELLPAEPLPLRAAAALPLPRPATPRRIAAAPPPPLPASAAEAPAPATAKAVAEGRAEPRMAEAARATPAPPVEPAPAVADAPAAAPAAFDTPAVAAAAAASDGRAPVAAAARDGPAPAAVAASDTSALVAAASDTPAAAAAAASEAPVAGFVWPPSTRLSYTLIGDVRGEVRGAAEVEWVREGTRYQVHLDVVIGPHFAPVARRRISSDGEITPGGLAPRRYDESTRVAFGRPQRLTLRFDDEYVTLADGSRAALLPALQDSASQFVQLTWRFLTGAERLQAGGRVEVPLALPRHVDRWVYEVVGEEPLHTPFGRITAWHLRPQVPPRPGTLAVEAWFAPSLQYLPVRLLIRQGAEHHIDLMIERLPQQALPP